MPMPKNLENNLEKMFFRHLLLLIFVAFISCNKDTTTAVAAPKTLTTTTSTVGSLLPKNNIGYTIEHTYYTLSYSEANRQAEWVAYNLSPSLINGLQARTDDFRIDPKVKNNAVSSGDYTGSGYDRGHLCPAADMKLNLTSMSETFYMSNMSPQQPSFNRGIWETLESRVRTWALEKNGVYVVTGPVLKSSCGSIDKGTIKVPCTYYKIIFKDNGADKIAIALLLNNQGSSASLKSFVTTIDNIENLTGIDFLSGLPDDIESKIESSINTASWSW